MVSLHIFYIKVVLLIIGWWTFQVCGIMASLSCEDRFLSTLKENKSLRGHIFMVIPNIGYIACGMRCLEEPGCFSLNYITDTHFCKLNFESVSDNPDDIRDDVGVILAEVVYKCNLPKMELTRISEPGMIGESALRNCYQLLHCDYKLANGIYEVELVNGRRLNLSCDMETVGGGWTVFQRRQDGSEDFYRLYADYRQGFGDLAGEFWLGNDNSHIFTKNYDQELRVDMEDFENGKVFSEYNDFGVDGEHGQFSLHLGRFLGGTAGDSLLVHNGQRFATHDVDTGGCAERYEGAWWYKKCHDSNLNGRYLRGWHAATVANGVNWLTFRGHGYSLKFTEMKFRPQGAVYCRRLLPILD